MSQADIPGRSCARSSRRTSSRRSCWKRCCWCTPPPSREWTPEEWRAPSTPCPRPPSRRLEQLVAMRLARSNGAADPPTATRPAAPPSQTQVERAGGGVPRQPRGRHQPRLLPPAGPAPQLRGRLQAQEGLMATLVYALCALTSLACAVLLLRGYASSRVRLLLWSGLCFCGPGAQQHPAARRQAAGAQHGPVALAHPPGRWPAWPSCSTDWYGRRAERRRQRVPGGGLRRGRALLPPLLARDPRPAVRHLRGGVLAAGRAARWPWRSPPIPTATSCCCTAFACWRSCSSWRPSWTRTGAPDARGDPATGSDPSRYVADARIPLSGGGGRPRLDLRPAVIPAAHLPDAPPREVAHVARHHPHRRRRP